MTEEQRHAANLTERNRLSAALNELFTEARCLPERSADEVWERLTRRGSTRTRAEVDAIFAAYDAAPHVHSVYTMHTFGTPCTLGVEHTGCCPGTKDCDHPGWYPARPA